jgi:uncharacterized OB-fold protein
MERKVPLSNEEVLELFRAQIQCSKCGRLFIPEKDYYNTCPECFAENVEKKDWEKMERRRRLRFGE